MALDDALRPAGASRSIENGGWIAGGDRQAEGVAGIARVNLCEPNDGSVVAGKASGDRFVRRISEQ